MAGNQEKSLERRTGVPWMFMDEWKKVFEDIYSKDIKLQKRGYEKMLVWKARLAKLPAGVDCSMELIRVHFIDKEVTEEISKGIIPVYAERDVQLMFSSALTRFLNNVTNITHGNMYAIAEAFNIPRWIVDLRHMSAHKESLPSLEALRNGVNFALEWLYENYWKLHESMPGWVISKTRSRFSDKRVAIMFDVWLSLKIYQMNGYQIMDEITDSKLRRSVAKFIFQNFDKNEMSGRLSTIIQRTRAKLFHAVQGDHSFVEKLIALLLECEVFIPPAHFITKGSKEDLSNESILKWISVFWEDMLIPLQENFGLFPNLVHKLIILLNHEECKHRQLVQALWIKQLCSSLFKSQMIMREAYAFPTNIIEKDNYNRMLSNEIMKPRINIPPKVFEIVHKQYSDLRNAYFALQNDEKKNSCPVSDVKLAVLNPNEYTMVFLPSLMDVAKPEISNQSRCLLQELVSICGKNDLLLARNDDRVHTVEELQKIKRKDKSELVSVNNDTSVLQEKKFSEYDWATCPLGILPWQRESPCVLDVPSHVTWKLDVTEVNAINFQCKTLMQTFHEPQSKEKVNWFAIMKKRSSINAGIKKRKKMTKKIKHLHPLQGTSKLP